MLAASGLMPSWAPSIFCPFMRRLIVVLSEQEPGSEARRDNLLLTRLMELEMDAERHDAPEASCRVIGLVRRIAGKAVTANYPPLIRGH